jgi:hypothetical protein
LDLLVNAVLLGRLLHVLPDAVAVGNRSVLVPWSPWKAECEEIRIGANAWRSVLVVLILLGHQSCSPCAYLGI